jgi:replicative DNA helicase
MIKKKKVTNIKPDIVLSETTFKYLLHYLFSIYVNHGFIKKLNIFFNSVNTHVYLSDPDVEEQYHLVKSYIDRAITDGIKDLDILYEAVSIDNKNNITDIDSIFEDFMNLNMTREEALYIENEFIDKLNYLSIFSHVEEMKKVISDLEKENYGSFREIVDRFKIINQKVNKELVSKNTTNMIIPDLNFKSEDFHTLVEKIHNRLSNEKRYIKTGIQRLNDLLGGGYQPGRVYVYLGITSGGKSCVLLNNILWAAKYNKDILCNDAAKKPMFIYLTQENDLDDTLDRIFSYCRAVETNGKIKSLETVFQLMEDEGLTSDECNIHLMFRPKFSISPADMETMINEIEAEGEYEVKMIVHDYLRRINPDIMVNDLRLDMAEVVNDFSLLAKRKKIVIITANQMNRSAYKMLLEGNEKKLDKAKDLNISVIGESLGIADNADGCIALHKSYDHLNNKYYMCFKDLKNRSIKSNQTRESTYFAHPFEGSNGMRLLEDLNEVKSLSKNNVSDGLDEYDIVPDNDDIEENLTKPIIKKKDVKVLKVNDTSDYEF